MDSESTGSRLGPPPDLWGILFLIASTFPLYWDRVRDGRHLARVDLVNQFLPNYTYLGERVRAGDLPGWNPYLNSGLPFLGDSVSGWGYLPAMLTFTILPPFAAFQANYMFHVWIAGLGMYGLGRSTGLGIWGAIAAGFAYQYGSIIAQLRSVNTQAQLTAWMPLAFLGVELALRSNSLRVRALGWGIGGVAVSQMLIGWTGQGSAYAFIVVVLYSFLRLVCHTASHPKEIVSNVVRHVGDGVAVLAFGLGLATAGLWIRWVVNQDSLIAGGTYERALGTAQRAHYLHHSELLSRLLQPRNYYYHGAATLSLACLALFVARRDRWRVWLNLSFAFVIVDLMVRQPVIRPLLFQIPNFQDLHEHSILKGLVLLGVPVALLAGMTVDAIANWKSGWHYLAGLAFLPMYGAAAVSLWINDQEQPLMPEPRKMIVAVGIIIGCISILFAAKSMVAQEIFQVAKGMALVALLVAMAWDPFGEAFGERLSSRTRILPPQEAFDVYLSRDDPNRPGEFLQERMEDEGPFRFLGYGPSILTAHGGRANSTYHGRFRDKLVVELLFSRAMRLELQSVQGYNPAQNERYIEFLDAINGERQNYHDANILRGGIDSPLLRLLNIRYIIVGKAQASKFDEIRWLEARYPTVFEDGTVKILEVTDAMPRCWIVHDVASAPREKVLGLLESADFDPTSQAVIEGPLPRLQASDDPRNEHVAVDHFSADRIELNATLTDPGLVVVSENYARGWQAYVDGKHATIYPTNHILRGVAVPAGKHTIVFRYAPPQIARGIVVSLSTAAVLLLLIVQPWRYALKFIRRLKARFRSLRYTDRFGQDPKGVIATIELSKPEGMANRELDPSIHGEL